MKAKRIIPNVSEVHLAQVGQAYMVPCVRMMTTITVGKEGDLVPVIGPPHDDLKHFGFNDVHWHIDWRFVNQAQYKRTEGCVRLALIIATKQAVDAGLHRKVMVREIGGFPKLRNGFRAMEEAYKDESLRPNMVCPHRGLCLRGIKPDIKGNIVCPGHGLAWNAETGRNVRHHRPEEPPCD